MSIGTFLIISHLLCKYKIQCLDWNEFLFIQPKVKPTFGVESLVEFADNGFVLRRMAEENTEFTGFSHVGFPQVCDMVKLYAQITPVNLQKFYTTSTKGSHPGYKIKKK
jgi:hypothetical protein